VQKIGDTFTLQCRRFGQVAHGDLGGFIVGINRALMFGFESAPGLTGSGQNRLGNFFPERVKLP
jgi:hypothetical protein